MGAPLLAPFRSVEDDALAQAALADLKRLAEQLGELLQQQHAGGEDAHPPGIELEALGDVVDRVAGEHPDRPLERLVLEHRADERRSEVALPPTATAWAGCSNSTSVEEVVDAVADPADLGRRGRVVGEQLVGERPRSRS